LKSCKNKLIYLAHPTVTGVKAAVAQAIERHRRLGQSISIWRDGKIVTLTADEIPPMQVETPIKKND